MQRLLLCHSVSGMAFESFDATPLLRGHPHRVVAIPCDMCSCVKYPRCRGMSDWMQGGLESAVCRHCCSWLLGCFCVQREKSTPAKRVAAQLQIVEGCCSMQSVQACAQAQVCGRQCLEGLKCTMWQRLADARAPVRVAQFCC